MEGASLARSLVRETPIPESVKRAIGREYSKLCDMYYPGVDVAVRSSATTEDSAEASFAGQYESYLNVSGESIVEKWKMRCQHVHRGGPWDTTWRRGCTHLTAPWQSW